MEWIAASEGDRVQKVMNEMTEHLKRLGPLHLEPVSIDSVHKKVEASLADTQEVKI